MAPSDSIRTASKWQKLIFKYVTQMINKGSLRILSYLFHSFKGIFPAKQMTMHVLRNETTVERLRLRLQIGLNLPSVSICLNFRLIVYYV